ncbi:MULTISPECIES: carbonic anhydrase [Roseivirga]|jgi:carbonic anhydrase|uniref:carbonic anhydrase n=1 Tax=Roseivirga thermotolerans TaxID=1758176 RepID=A0ABQ3I6B7_9BACT|nr:MULTISPECIES: carbonic anhydrase [Roseivirga]MEC7754167.1 carbonic anhydrase [Bacteroidota bacterium]GHE60304.1 carbonic anhydrase [Roseivirga thermotolerans]|tara:strand:- start:3832 stop:4470 length:639 start_codon:yes stop_codon:yes gene_type:complete
MSNSINLLKQGNIKWVESVKEKDPTFFDELAKGQSPEFLWIGCSDSRVPATQITDTMPGSIFVQRNIANMVVHTDSNLLSVVYYAVKVLKVKHIVVCGHYGCGGVKAAMSNQKFGFLDNWLLHIKDAYRANAKELDAIENEDDRFNRFVELNVKEQVQNLAKVSFLQEEWDQGEFPYIHGWVYSLKDGLIKDLGYTINSNQGLQEVYKYSGE